MAALTAASSSAAAAAAAESQTAGAPALAYPQTKRVDVVEDQFGVKVADPYRWLETDVRNDAEVRSWVTAQNVVTDAFLETLPARDDFEKRITELYDYERFGLPDPGVARSIRVTSPGEYLI